MSSKGYAALATMTLSEFVENSLTDILKGIVAAQENDEVGEFVAKGDIGPLSFPANSGVIREGGMVATTVKFDVAVTAKSRGGGGSGAGFNIGVVRGQLGADTTERSEGISRIQFAVPLILPESETTRDGRQDRTFKA